MEAAAGVWSGVRQGPERVGPQMCDAMLCPPFPITVAGTLPLRQLLQRTSKSYRRHQRFTALAHICW